MTRGASTRGSSSRTPLARSPSWRGEGRGKGVSFGLFALLLALILPAAAETAATGDPLAEVDGEAITAGEVENALGAPLRRLEEQIYALKRQALEALIAERLLAREAAERGITVRALLDAEVTAKAGPVSEQEIDAAYQAQEAQLKGNEAGLREQIRNRLLSQRLAAARRAFLESLRARSQVVIHLKAPPVFRVDVNVDGAPVKGPATAPVTLVEFSDFHCPFCKRVQPTLEKLLARYGERVQLVYRDFPIDQLHPQARKAHEAARCAHDQGKFWAYHDRLFANAPKASPEDLRAYAREVGLDMTVFERCLTSGTHQAAVQRDEDEGIRAGVTGTPAFFINGRLLSGAQPLESFVRLIEEELARVR